MEMPLPPTPRKKQSSGRLKKYDESEFIFAVDFEGKKYEVDVESGDVLDEDDFDIVGKWNEKTGRIDFNENHYRMKLKKMSSPELRKIAKESTVPFEKKHAKDILTARDMMVKRDPDLRAFFKH